MLFVCVKNHPILQMRLLVTGKNESRCRLIWPNLYNGVWKRSPQRDPRAKSRWRISEVPLKLKAFFHFLSKYGSKVKDLNKKNCLPSVCGSDDQPLGQWRGGRPVRSYLDPPLQCLTSTIKWSTVCQYAPFLRTYKCWKVQCTTSMFVYV